MRLVAEFEIEAEREPLEDLTIEEQARAVACAILVNGVDVVAGHWKEIPISFGHCRFEEGSDPHSRVISLLTQLQYVLGTMTVVTEPGRPDYTLAHPATRSLEQIAELSERHRMLEASKG